MIYFVEDDNSIRKLVLYSLTSAGMEAEGFARPGEFWSALDRQIPQVVAAVETGLIPMEVIDTALGRVVGWKYDLGLIDDSEILAMEVEE